jgi:NAD+ diphosphatase
MTFRFYFDAITLDRAPHLRRDDDWVADSLSGTDSRIIPVWRDRSLIFAGGDENGTPASVMLTNSNAAPILEVAETIIFLGLEDNIAYYAADLPIDKEPEDLPLPAGAEFEDLRYVASIIDQAEAGYLAYARALSHWHRTHKFCGACGAQTIAGKGGHERKCSNQDCGRSHFPRTDPAVIMLVTHPTDEACLLGHNKRFQGLRFSTIAGFVEPGETLEQAVAREVWEETGIRAENVRYQASQPWPFPASIMLGFRADGVSTEINLIDEELVEARWFSRQEVRDMADSQEGILPPAKFSISRWLIDNWLAEK